MGTISPSKEAFESIIQPNARRSPENEWIPKDLPCPWPYAGWLMSYLSRHLMGSGKLGHFSAPWLTIPGTGRFGSKICKREYPTGVSSDFQNSD